MVWAKKIFIYRMMKEVMLIKNTINKEKDLITFLGQVYLLHQIRENLLAVKSIQIEKAL